MKKLCKETILALVLVPALLLGALALAESEGTESTPAPAAADAAEDAAPTEDTAPAEDADADALQDALDAYRSARESSYGEELEEELNGYVAEGKLTQEQAELILSYYREQQSLRDGVCPNCGYEFRSGKGFGRDGRFGKGGHGRGGYRGMSGVPQASVRGSALAGEAAAERSA